jgi:hypothetical protein
LRGSGRLGERVRERGFKVCGILRFPFHRPRNLYGPFKESKENRREIPFKKL